jgi:hypothetical protein
VDAYVTPYLSIMKNVVRLAFTWPPVLEHIVIIGDDVRNFCFSTYRAAAPKLRFYFGERICNFV